MPGAMLGLWWQYDTAKGLHGMPSPVDGDPNTPWPVDVWADLAQRFLTSGGTVLVTPPLTKGASLGSGYDPFNHWDLGSNPYGPAGRRETRWGSVEQVARFCAQVRSLGGEVYANIVHHHMDGDPGNWRYDYLAADGVTPGRFPKDENCFWVPSAEHRINPDRVFDPTWDIGFGREPRWLTGTYGDGQGANGPGYMKRGLAESLDWQLQRLDIAGMFLDDAKGTNPDYIAWLLQQGAMAGREAFVELSDGNTGTLEYWMGLTGHRAGVMDFALRYKIRDVCNSSADMRSILSEGVCWRDPAHAITFIEDIDLDISDPIKQRSLLGNSLILGFPGYPLLFPKHVLPPPAGYGQNEEVWNLLWCYATFAKGDLWWREAQADHLVWEMMGDSTSSGVVCAASIRDDWHKVTVQTKWKGTWLHDYGGQAEDQRTDAQGNLTFWVPPDRQGAGRGYVRYAVQNVENPIRLAPKPARQRIVGVSDLDTLPLGNGGQAVTWVQCRAGTTLRLDFAPLVPLPAGASYAMRVSAPDGTQLGQSQSVPTLELPVGVTGQHRIGLSGNGLPDNGLPYELTATYSA